MSTRHVRIPLFVLIAGVLLTLASVATFAQESAPAAPQGATVPPIPQDISLPLIFNGTPLQATPVASVSAGDEFACALSTAGEVYCWGWHTVEPWLDAKAQYDIVPVKVAGLANVQEISAGFVHACALLADTTVACWGDNFYSQLGYSGEPSAQPVAVSNLSGVVQVEAGTLGTCVLLEEGGVKCWGTMRLFDGTDFVTHLLATPTAIAGVESGVAAISMRGSHGCALMEDGTVKCWGSNARGALGDGTLDDSLAAVDVVGLPEGIVSVSAGIQRTCVVTAEGGVLCWGSNEFDHLGDGSDVDYSLTPVQVVGLESGVASVDVGFYHACVTLENGTVQCWGAGAPLGDGSDEAHSTPVQVADLSNATQVTSGRFFSCAVTTTQAARCWGQNYLGQLGNGSVADSVTPSWVAGMDKR